MLRVFSSYADLIRFLRRLHAANGQFSLTVVSRRASRAPAFFPVQDPAFRAADMTALPPGFMHCWASDARSDRGNKEYRAGGLLDFFAYYSGLHREHRIHYDMVRADRPVSFYADLEFDRYPESLRNQAKDCANMLRAVKQLVAGQWNEEHNDERLHASVLVVFDSSSDGDGILRFPPAPADEEDFLGLEPMNLNGGDEANDRAPSALVEMSAADSQTSRGTAGANAGGDAQGTVSKVSFHIHCQRMWFRNDVALQAFMRRVQARAQQDEHVRELLCVDRLENRKVRGVFKEDFFPDMGVYSNNRCFRLVYSTKKGRERYMLPLEVPGALVSSMSQSVRVRLPVLLSAIVQLPCASFYRALTASDEATSVASQTTVSGMRINNVSRRVSTWSGLLPRGNGSSDPFALLTQFVAQRYHDATAKVKPARPGEGARDVLTFQLSTRDCEVHGRTHKSNHPYVIADLKHGIVYQKCHRDGTKGGEVSIPRLGDREEMLEQEEDEGGSAYRQHARDENDDENEKDRRAQNGRRRRAISNEDSDGVQGQRRRQASSGMDSRLGGREARSERDGLWWNFPSESRTAHMVLAFARLVYAASTRGRDPFDHELIPAPGSASMRYDEVQDVYVVDFPGPIAVCHICHSSLVLEVYRERLLVHCRGAERHRWPRPSASASNAGRWDLQWLFPPPPPAFSASSIVSSGDRNAEFPLFNDRQLPPNEDSLGALNIHELSPSAASLSAMRPYDVDEDDHEPMHPPRKQLSRSRPVDDEGDDVDFGDHFTGTVAHRSGDEDEDGHFTGGNGDESDSGHERSRDKRRRARGERSNNQDVEGRFVAGPRRSRRNANDVGDDGDANNRNWRVVESSGRTARDGGGDDPDDLGDDVASDESSESGDVPEPPLRRSRHISEGNSVSRDERRSIDVGLSWARRLGLDLDRLVNEPNFYLCLGFAQDGGGTPAFYEERLKQLQKWCVLQEKRAGRVGSVSTEQFLFLNNVVLPLSRKLWFKVRCLFICLSYLFVCFCLFIWFVCFCLFICLLAVVCWLFLLFCGWLFVVVLLVLFFFLLTPFFFPFSAIKGYSSNDADTVPTCQGEDAGNRVVLP